MFSRINSGGLEGINGYLVQVEADAGDGLPDFSMVGYLATQVREAQDRVKAAIKNSGFYLSPMKVTLNLSPANLKKEGTAYDLPIALAVLGAYGFLDLFPYRDCAFIGELGLDGSVKEVTGILPLVISLRECGIRRFFLPAGNVEEGYAVDDVDIIAVRSLVELTEQMKRPQNIRSALRKTLDPYHSPVSYPVDFSEICGQHAARRATEIAVAGRHNILYIGPPGSGKSMIAQRIPTVMPDLTKEEQIEVAKVYSVCGMFRSGNCLTRIRPFRSPHHTISPQALAGGGKIPCPGEISLASRGVLFLDELPEFRRRTLEILRQPMEEHKVTISRMQGTCSFPADFMLAAAMNPCPCGHFPDRSRCSCNELQVKRYLNKISGPLLDRIDICVEAAPVSYAQLREKGKNESSAAIRKRIIRAHEIQKKRFEGTGKLFNSEMTAGDVSRFCAVDRTGEIFLKKIFSQYTLSARGCSRILKVSRTIADLDGSESIRKIHLTEAFGYRSLEERYWGRG